MNTTIALLRGINVGGKRMKMADLRTLFADMGFPNAKTMLQTGNVAFQTDSTDTDQLVTTIEKGIQDHFGFESRIIIRTPDQIRAVLDNHPFTDEQLENGKWSIVAFLNTAPNSSDLDALISAHQGPEFIHLQGKELFVYYTEGAARSKLTNNFIEKYLEVVSTARNWNTTRKLLDLAAELDGE